LAFVTLISSDGPEGYLQGKDFGKHPNKFIHPSIQQRPMAPAATGIGKRKAENETLDDFIKRFRDNSEEHENGGPPAGANTSLEAENDNDVLLPEDAHDIEGYLEAADKVKVSHWSRQILSAVLFVNLRTIRLIPWT
jgi:hypothetical protein